MGLSAVTQIALHWCVVTPHYMGVCTWYWFGTTFGAESCGLGMGRSPIEFHDVKWKWKIKCVGVTSRG